MLELAASKMKKIQVIQTLVVLLCASLISSASAAVDELPPKCGTWGYSQWLNNPQMRLIAATFVDPYIYGCEASSANVVTPFSDPEYITFDYTDLSFISHSVGTTSNYKRTSDYTYIPTTVFPGVLLSKVENSYSDRNIISTIKYDDQSRIIQVFTSFSTFNETQSYFYEDKAHPNFPTMITQLDGSKVVLEWKFNSDNLVIEEIEISEDRHHIISFTYAPQTNNLASYCSENLCTNISYNQDLQIQKLDRYLDGTLTSSILYKYDSEQNNIVGVYSSFENISLSYGDVPSYSQAKVNSGSGSILNSKRNLFNPFFFPQKHFGLIR